MSEKAKADRRSLGTRLKEVGIAVPIITVEYQDGKPMHVWYNNLDKGNVVDLLEIFDIYEIKRVINQENKTAIELVIDGYLSEKDYDSEGEQMSEVAEPENGNEDEEKPDEEAPATETEAAPEGEESEATE